MILWFFNIDDFPDKSISDYLSHLPHTFALQIKQFKNINDQKSRLISKLLVQKYILDSSNYWDWDNWKLDLLNKPFIENGPFFSISHSNKIVVVAFSSKYRIGVDIEEKQKIDVSSVANMLHLDEYVFLKKRQFDLDLFYRIWTKKEAFLKGIGIGFIDGINKISVLNSPIEFGTNWYLKEINIFQEYKCAVCLNSYIEDIDFCFITFGDLKKRYEKKII